MGTTLPGGRVELNANSICLGGVGAGGVVAAAQGQNRAAVQVDALVGVQSAVAAPAVGQGDDLAAVDDQVAVGVDAVALISQAGVDVESAAVDGGDGYPVLVGVNAVVLGGNGDIAAVDGEVELAVKPLVGSGDVQLAVASGLTLTFMLILE